MDNENTFGKVDIKLEVSEEIETKQPIQTFLLKRKV